MQGRGNGDMLGAMTTSDSSRTRRVFEVILNRESGTLRELWHEGLPEELEEVFASHGVEARVRPASPPKLDEALDEAIRAEPDAVIIGGGDGTVSNAAARLAGGVVPLGVLPFGTFNLAARGFGVPLEARAAAEALAGAEVVPVDVLDVAGRACLCITMIGFYPAMMRHGREYHGRAWWRKSLGIARRMFAGWRDAPPLALTVDTRENGRLSRVTRFAAIVPGEYDDIFSLLPRRRVLDGGRMMLYLSRHHGLLAMTRGALAYLTGMLRADRDIERIETKEVELTVRRLRELDVTIDGELLRLPLPLTLRVRPGALKVLKVGGEAS